MDYIKVSSKGSYFVGGERVTLSGGEPVKMCFWPGGPELNYDPNGDFQAGQMYVQYTRLADPVLPYPVCMIHGGGGTGALWESTQQGGPGLGVHVFGKRFSCKCIRRCGAGQGLLGPISANQSHSAHVQQLCRAVDHLPAGRKAG